MNEEAHTQEESTGHRWLKRGLLFGLVAFVLIQCGIDVHQSNRHHLLVQRQQLQAHSVSKRLDVLQQQWQVLSNQMTQAQAVAQNRHALEHVLGLSKKSHVQSVVLLLMAIENNVGHFTLSQTLNQLAALERLAPTLPSSLQTGFKNALNRDEDTLAQHPMPAWDQIDQELNGLQQAIVNLKRPLNHVDHAPNTPGIMQRWPWLMSAWQGLKRVVVIQRQPIMSQADDLKARLHLSTLLMRAQQALLKHQEKDYKLSLINAMTVVRASFSDNKARQTYLKVLHTLSQQTVRIKPVPLESLAFLEADLNNGSA